MTDKKDNPAPSTAGTSLEKVRILTNQPTQQLLEKITAAIGEPLKSLNDRLEDMDMNDVNDGLADIKESLKAIKQENLSEIMDALNVIKKDISDIKNIFNTFNDALTNINWGDN